MAQEQNAFAGRKLVWEIADLETERGLAKQRKEIHERIAEGKKAEGKK